MTKITPCLWFNNRIDEAIDFYTTTFPNTVVKQRYSQSPGTPTFTAIIELAGQDFFLLNGSGDSEPMYPFNEAVSFMIECADQAEVDHYWNGFVDNGGAESRCGWCKDKFGVSWQVVPVQLHSTTMGPDKEGSQRAFQAMLGMKKLIVAELEAAYRGD